MKLSEFVAWATTACPRCSWLSTMTQRGQTLSSSQRWSRKMRGQGVAQKAEHRFQNRSSIPALQRRCTKGSKP